MVKRKRVPQKNDWIAGNAIEPQQWPKLEGAAGVKFDETARGEIQFLVYGLLEGAIQSEAPLDAQRRKQIEKIAARAEELSQSLEALPIFVKLRVDEAIDSHRNGTLLATLNSPPDCHRLGLEAGELAIAIRKLAVSEKKGRGGGARVRAEIAKHFMARIEQVFSYLCRAQRKKGSLEPFLKELETLLPSAAKKELTSVAAAMKLRQPSRRRTARSSSQAKPRGKK